MIDRSILAKHAFAEAARVSREGGTGRAALPHPDSRELVAFEIDRRGATEIVSWLYDKIVAELLDRERRGEPLSDLERELLRIWRESVPHMYHVAASPGGPSWLIPLNAHGRPIGVSAEEIELAALPHEYDIGWLVPETCRTIPLSRIRTGFRTWREIGRGTIHFPPGAGLLSAWMRLKSLNEEMWEAKSRSH